MIKMKKYVVMFCAMLATGLIATSCSSDEDAVQSVTGEGTVVFDVTANVGFYSRAALDESPYKVLDNYTVQILDANGDEHAEYAYKNLPVTLKVPAGTYQLKAFYGTDVPYSTTSMYVEGVGGKVAVAADAEEPVKLSVSCKPVCAKVVVDFDEDLGKYFDSYSVSFKTEAIGTGIPFVWKKGDTDPVYLKVKENENVAYTVTAKYKDTTIADAVVNGTYKLSPQSGLTLHVAPAGNGNVSISITINETTNDIEQDIEVPNEWVTDKGGN